jgi:hypothetical protein
MDKLQRRGWRKPLVRLWVKELTVYDTMWCIVQKPRVLQYVLDLCFQRLMGGAVLWNSVMTVI